MNQTQYKKIKKLLHDINSPLTTILGYSDLLKRRSNPEWADTIKEEAKKISGMVKEIQSSMDELELNEGMEK